MRSVIAIALAAVAATLFALSTTLQAMEARETPPESALRASLIQKLMRRRKWLLGSGAGVLAWPAQAFALVFGSIALVQPAMGFGLVVLLALGVRMLGEHVGRREIAGVSAIAVAVGVLGWAAPKSTGKFTTVGVAITIAWLAVSLAGPYVLRVLHLGGGLAGSVVAGLGWGAVGLATALLDQSVANRNWIVAVLWGLGVAAASWGALLSEMSALQVWPATRAIPVVFGLEMVLPAAASVGITVHGPGAYGGVPFALALAVACVGAIVLGSSPAVARTVEA